MPRISLFVSLFFSFIFSMDSSNAQDVNLFSVDQSSFSSYFVNGHENIKYQCIYNETAGALYWTAPSDIHQFTVCLALVRFGLPDKTIYRITTSDSRLVIPNEIRSNLIPGAKYAVKIEGFFSFDNYSTKKYEVEDFVVLVSIPECTAPKDIKIESTIDGTFIINWKGPEASSDGVKYRLRYRSQSLKDGNWIELVIESGLSIELGPVPDGDYVFEIKKVCDKKLDGSNLESDWIQIIGEMKREVARPGSGCGVPFTYTPSACDSVVSNWDTIEMYGFKIAVDSLFFTEVYFENGTLDTLHSYTGGIGTIILPFGSDLKIQVEFYRLWIDGQGWVCSCNPEEYKGALGLNYSPTCASGILDPSFVLDTISDPLNIASKFCQESVWLPDGTHVLTGELWDPYGFGQDGLYIIEPPYPGYVPGMPFDTTRMYDPNGYNAAGIHVLTGTVFNPLGCRRDSVNENNQSCIPTIPPYSWMGLSPQSPTIAGLSFYDSIAPQIDSLIQIALGTLKAQFQDSLDWRNDICDSIRLEMRNDLNALVLANYPIDSSYIFGPSSKYFNSGLSEHFSSAPKMLLQNYTVEQRLPEVKSIEDNHIHLYECDLSYMVYLHFIEIINLHMVVPGRSEIKDEISTIIRSLSATQINEFKSNPTAFFSWLKGQVGTYIKDKYESEHGLLGQLDINPEIEFRKMDRKIDSEVLVASANYFHIGQQESLDQLVFELKQGFQEINGRERVYALEQIANLRNADKSTTYQYPALEPVVFANIGSDGTTNSIFLDNFRFYADRPAEVDIHFLLQFPGSSQRIPFRMTDVKFTPNGFLLDTIYIRLENDVSVHLTEKIRLNLLANETGIFVTCDGFGGVKVAADVEFCRSLVMPYDFVKDTILPDPERVHGRIETYCPNFSELFVFLKIQPFVITDYPDYKWRVDSIAIDLSESMSSNGLVTPGYTSPFTSGNHFLPGWKGFYAANLSVTFPKKFTSDSSEITVGVSNLIIDKFGVSCKVYADSILSISKGNAGGWAFSIAEFDLLILKNQLIKGSLSGLIHVPIFRAKSNTTGTFAADDCFRYGAEITRYGGFLFTVAPPPNSGFAVDMWKAPSVDLSSSAVTIAYQNNDFHCTAFLNGKIQLSDSTSNLQLPNVEFENVGLSNRAPHFSAGNWKVDKIAVDFHGFELNIDSFLVKTDTSDNNPYLSIRSRMTIGDESSNHLSAYGGFRVKGELVDDFGRQRWKLKKFSIDSLFINGHFPGVPYVFGFVKFFEKDSIFGSGFRGGLDARFEMFDASFKVVGQFGRMETATPYKYFMVDAMVCKDIPLAGDFVLKGFGGGAYRRMNRIELNGGVTLCTGDTTSTIPTGLGLSLSGLQYVPDVTKDLGLKVTLAGGLRSSEQAFNMNASFEINFTSSGALDKISLYGNGKFMEPLTVQASPKQTKGTKPNNAAVAANVDLTYDFTNDKLHGQLEVFAKIGNILHGSGSGDRLVAAELLLDRKNSNWYLKVGRPYPGQYAGAKINLGIKFSTSTYFQIGKQLDPMPPLSQFISNIFAKSGKPLFQEDQRYNLGGGNGFAFGLGVKVTQTDFSSSILYASIGGEFGVDFSLAKYQGILCENTQSPLGINGWYAQGKMYAGLLVDAGVKWKDNKYPVFKTSLAAVLQAKLPNPNWVKGDFVVNYNILGGLVKGTKAFDFEFGERCEIAANPNLSEAQIILYTDPLNEQKVPVYANPSVTFAAPVGQAITYSIPAGGSLSYKIILDSVHLKLGGYNIPVTFEWKEDSSKLELKPNWFLPGNDSILFTIVAHIDSFGVNVKSETRVVKFFTEKEIDFIPPTNIAGAYPFDGQYNFYKNEIPDQRGYIALLKSQINIFVPKEGYLKVMRFRQAGGKCASIILSESDLDIYASEITYPYPQGFFEENGVYEMQLLEYATADPRWNGNFKTGQAPCYCDGCTVPAVPPVPPAAGTGIMGAYASSQPISDDPIPNTTSTVPVNPFEKVLYTAYFRTSQYATFLDKMEALEITVSKNTLKGEQKNDVQNRFGIRDFCTLTPSFELLSDTEPFDVFERESLIDISFPNSSGGNHFHTGIRFSLLYDVVGQSTISQPLQLTTIGNQNLKINKLHFPAKFSYATSTMKYYSTLGSELVSAFEWRKADALSTILSNASQILSYTGSTDLDSHVYGRTPVELCDLNQIFASEIRVLNTCNILGANTTPPTHDYPMMYKYMLPNKQQASSTFTWTIKK